MSATHNAEDREKPGTDGSRIAGGTDQECLQSVRSGRDGRNQLLPRCTCDVRTQVLDVPGISGDVVASLGHYVVWSGSGTEVKFTALHAMLDRLAYTRLRHGRAVD